MKRDSKKGHTKSDAYGYVMALLEVGEISSGKAAEILGVSRLETIEMMNKWGISIFDDSSNGGVTSRSGTGRINFKSTKILK